MVVLFLVWKLATDKKSRHRFDLKLSDRKTDTHLQLKPIVQILLLSLINAKGLSQKGHLPFLSILLINPKKLILTWSKERWPFVES